MSSPEDRRIRRTKTILRSALISLLSEKELYNITISELTEQADVNRGTFYSHYSDIYHLFSEMEQEVLDDLLQILLPVLKNPLTWRVGVQDFLSFVKNNESVFFIILRTSGPSFYDKLIAILHTCVETVGKFSFSSEKLEHYEYLYVYSLTGIINIMLSWKKRECPHSIEEMSELIELLILRTFPSLPNNADT